MDISSYLRFILALMFVVGMIGALAYLAKRSLPMFRNINTGPTRRIGIVEVATLDARRRLVLLRRDDVEHLVILGPTSETVVEKNITAVSEEDVAAMKASFEVPGGRQT